MMRYIIEKIQNNERTYYGPFYLEKHAQHVIDESFKNDMSLATYHIHVLRPEASLQKPV
jgi:hypothetical protein